MLIELFNWLGIDPATYLKSTFEQSIFVLFVLCFLHSTWVNGLHRTLREFSAGFFLTALLENIGVLSGAYVYPGFSVYVYATPLLNPLSWVAIVYIVSGFTSRMVYGPRYLASYPVDGYNRLDWSKYKLASGSVVITFAMLAFLDAGILVLVDLIEDPLATIFNWWIWVPYEAGVIGISEGAVNAYNFDNHIWMTTPDNSVATYFAQFFPEGFKYPTRYLGIPIVNFIDWFLLVFCFSFSLRWVEDKDWSEIKKTIILWSLMFPISLILIPTILLNI